MLIYYYWFQFSKLYLLEAAPLKPQPRRIWIEIPGITNAFHLCLESNDFWVSNDVWKQMNGEVIFSWPVCNLQQDHWLLPCLQAASQLEAWVFWKMPPCVRYVKPLVHYFGLKRDLKRPPVSQRSPFHWHIKAAGCCVFCLEIKGMFIVMWGGPSDSWKQVLVCPLPQHLKPLTSWYCCAQTCFIKSFVKTKLCLRYNRFINFIYCVCVHVVVFL